MPNRKRIHAKFVRNFFGLGFGLERSIVCDEKTKWAAIHIKVFMGPFIILYTIDSKKKEPIC